MNPTERPAMSAQVVEASTPDALPPTTQAVVELFKDMVYAIALTHAGNRGDADDVFQEVFLTYHRKQPVSADDDHRRAWLITTTLNIARRAASSSWRTRVVPLRPEMADEVAVTPGFALEEHDDLFKALTVLGETYRTVIHLFYFEDMPIAKIANLLGLEPSAVKMRLSRGRAILRDNLTMEE